MKFTAALIALCATTAAADFFGTQQQLVMGDVNDTDNDVPGKNPLQFCEDTTEYILELDNVDLSPNPPEAGKTLTIEATGVFQEQVDDGAYAVLEVKWGLVKILTLTEDLCEQLENFGQSCPLEKGNHTLIREIELPQRIPPGVYSVKADVFTKDDRKITCLQSKIKFG